MQRGLVEKLDEVIDRLENLTDAVKEDLDVKNRSGRVDISMSAKEAYHLWIALKNASENKDNPLPSNIKPLIRKLMDSLR